MSSGYSHVHRTGHNADFRIKAQIDLEAQRGQVSQSFQIAPFDDGYWPSNNSTANWVSYDAADVVVNEYRGGIYQQALSHLAYVNDDGFVDGGGGFAVYGMSRCPALYICDQSCTG